MVCYCSTVLHKLNQAGDLRQGRKCDAVGEMLLKLQCKAGLGGTIKLTNASEPTLDCSCMNAML